MTMERTNPLGQSQTLRELSPVLRTLFTGFLLTIGLSDHRHADDRRHHFFGSQCIAADASDICDDAVV